MRPANFRLRFSIESLEDRRMLAADLLDFAPGPQSSNAAYLGEVNNLMIVSHAGDPSVGREIYASDGTVAGSSLLIDANPGVEGLWVARTIGTFNGKLVFQASTTTDYTGMKFFATDGTPGGTAEIHSLGHDLLDSRVTVAGDRMFWINASTDSNHELWSSDGTAAGTAKVLDFGPGTTNELLNAGDRVFVHSIEETDQGAGETGYETRIYVSDGTTAGSNVVFEDMHYSQHFTAVVSDEGRIVFTTTEYDYRVDSRYGTQFVDNGTHLWTSDGGQATELLYLSRNDPRSFSHGMDEANGVFYYTIVEELDTDVLINDPVAPTHEYTTWGTDGTVAGTSMIQSIDGLPRDVIPEQVIEFDGYTVIAIEELVRENNQDFNITQWYTTTDGFTLDRVHTSRTYQSHMLLADKLWIRDSANPYAAGGDSWTEISGPGSAKEVAPWFVAPTYSNFQGEIPTLISPNGKAYFVGRSTSSSSGLAFEVSESLAASIPVAQPTSTSSMGWRQIFGFYQGDLVFQYNDPATGTELYIDTPNPTSGVINGTLLVSGTAGNDTISVFQAPNSDDLSVIFNGVRTDYANLTGIAIDGGTGNDRITLGGSVPFAARIDGGGGDDFILATLFDDIIRGGDGNDTVLALQGSDRVDGESGNDRIFAGSGSSFEGDTIHGGDGDDNLFGSNRADTIFGGNGDDFIHGVLADDILSGGNGDDRIVGGSGADQIHGDEGDDRLFGNAGADEIFGGDGDDEAYGAEEGDRLFGNKGNDRLFGMGANDYIEGGQGDDYLNGSGGKDTLYGIAGDDELVGGDGNDFLFGDGQFYRSEDESEYDEDNVQGNDTIYGGRGADEIFGNDGDDFLSGQGGQDTINTGNGNDTAHGGNDADYIESGGAGVDSLYGDDGDDIIKGGGLLYGGAGNDTVEGGGFNDFISGGAGADNLRGGAGIDTIHGDDGNDIINGDAGNNKLYGDQGDDILLAFNGHDIMDGGDGNDVLDAGFGNDTVMGGAGNDVLLAGGGIDEVYGGAGSDFIIGEVVDTSGIYESNSAWSNLRTIWNRNQSLTTKQYVIGNGTDASFSFKFKFGERSRIDALQDKIFGGDGADLVFAESNQVMDMTSIDIWTRP